MPTSAVDTGRKQIIVSSATSTSSSCEGPPPKKNRLDNPLVTALILMYAACALEPMRTVSWKERVRNGFPVHVGDGCMKTVVKIVELMRMVRSDSALFFLDFLHNVFVFFLLTVPFSY